MSKTNSYPAQDDADAIAAAIWWRCGDIDGSARAAILDDLLLAASLPAQTAQILLNLAVYAEGGGWQWSPKKRLSTQFLQVLCQYGAVIKGTLFENFINAKSHEFHVDYQTRRNGPFNLSTESLNAFRIPSDADWQSVGWDLDTPYAYEHFSGRTLDEARDGLEEKELFFSEDFFYIPNRCLQFYALAYMEYLVSPRSNGKPDTASAFFGFLKLRANDIALWDKFLKSRLSSTLSLLAKSQEWFDADRGIYGDFAEHSDACYARIDLS